MAARVLAPAVLGRQVAPMRLTAPATERSLQAFQDLGLGNAELTADLGEGMRDQGKVPLPAVEQGVVDGVEGDRHAQSPVR